ncbi:coiled-coil domain-containing protein 177 [Eurosta solidaginis]|uniref:coiled-coil domain-containing protein 177 n=1 Tax=Eurosta solidaginis TaxID=178769 RepID=UPI0035310E8E
MQARATARSSAAEEHWRLLAQLDLLNLNDSCCEICHCDCYSSHRSSSDSDPLICAKTCGKIDKSLTLPSCQFETKACDELKPTTKFSALSLKKQPTRTENTPCTSVDNNKSKKRLNRKSKSTKRKNASEASPTNYNLSTKPSSTHATNAIIRKSKSAKNTPIHSGRTSPAPTAASSNGAVPKHSSSSSVNRSRSVCSLRSRRPTPLLAPLKRTRPKHTKYKGRDCKILQDVLSAHNDDVDAISTISLQVSGKSVLKGKSEVTRAKPDDTAKILASTQSHTLPRCAVKAKPEKITDDNCLKSQKLCASVASLCLAPTVRAAYQQIPSHDKRILNRMAHKRSERAIAKDNAWLARKYWENERYERELFKCAQMEEYKRAIRDKQFQDYLLTKARLNEIAQRDLSELQRLRNALEEKDVNTNRRLDALRVERGIATCQRRCDELRRVEAVTVQQESQQVDEQLKKEEICTRSNERLQRAEQIRTEMLESYLRRLRYDNYMEGLVHEEQWLEAQKLERQRRAQLADHIQQKREQSQRFIEARQRRKQAITRKAKLAASLRELVRNSVTPDGGGAVDGLSGVGSDAVSIGNTAMLSKVLLERPYSKQSLQS